MRQIFNFISEKVCFTFSVAVFSVLGGQMASALGIVFIWATVDFNATGTLKQSLILAPTLVTIAAICHYIFYGLGRLWGKKWESADLQLLNDNIAGQKFISNVSAENLKSISLYLDTLPVNNAKLATFFSLPVLIIGIFQEIFTSGSWENGLGIFRGGIIAWVSYIMFTLIITEIITSKVRCEARRLLTLQKSWPIPINTSSLNRKFGYILTFMVMSIIITYYICTENIITSKALTITILSVLVFIIGFFMCILVILSIMIPLREIQQSAASQSPEGDILFFTGSIDREIFQTADMLFTSAKELEKYQNRLINLNEDLEKNVQKRTAELQETNENLQKEIAKRKSIETDLRISKQKYKELSITDSLTRLFNKHQLYNQLEDEVERAHRYNTPLSVMMLDIDNFKVFNDTWGHLEGDKILSALGEIILDSKRRIDTAYRYGGEEFTVILPSSTGKEAITVADRIRSNFADQVFYPLVNEPQSITVSIGIAQYIAGENLTTLLDRADKCMYMAKEKGKNRTIYRDLSDI